MAFVAILTMNSCTKDIELQQKESNECLDLRDRYNIENYSNKVTLEELQIISDSLKKVLFVDVDPETKTINRIEELKDEEGELNTLIYVIVYNGGGFLLISADKRYTPILAYGDNEEWGSEDLGGVDIWIHCTKEEIKKSIIKSIFPKNSIWVQWKKYFSDDPFSPKIIPDDPNNPEPCPTNYQVWETGRFVSQVAQWRQRGIFSFYSPMDNGCDPCNKKPAGCGPVAMAMVMRYYQRPLGQICFNGECTSNDYLNMPLTGDPSNCNTPTGGERSAAILTRFCGGIANSGYGVFGNCSTYTFWSNIPEAFHDWAGYSSGGDWGKYSSKLEDAIKDLRNFKPILFTGTLNAVNLSDWHIWVGDGLKIESYTYGGYDPNDPEVYEGVIFPCQTIVNRYIGMNWGWGGLSNAYYLENGSFNANGSTYDTYLKILTNIKP